MPLDRSIDAMSPEPSSDLPAVATDAVFVDHTELRGRACVVVDGPVLPGCALTLSHWPTAATPPALAADTSTEIVDRYLRLATRGPSVGAVTNNHYDEDGILGLWMLLERPPIDDPRRTLAIESAEAGDFRTWTTPWAPKVALALAAFAERPTTPFPDVLRALSSQSGRDPAGAICAAVLPRVGALLDDPLRYQRFWQPMWSAVEEDLALVDSGAVLIQELPDVDLAVVRSSRVLDPLAIYPRTRCSRVLTIVADELVAVRDRYESWVRFASRRVPPRVDLTALAERLTASDPLAGGRWRYEGVAAITPRLLRSGPGGGAMPTGLDPAMILDELIATYASADADPLSPSYDQAPPMDLLP